MPMLFEFLTNRIYIGGVMLKTSMSAVNKALAILSEHHTGARTYK